MHRYQLGIILQNENDHSVETLETWISSDFQIMYIFIMHYLLHIINNPAVSLIFEQMILAMIVENITSVFNLTNEVETESEINNMIAEEVTDEAWKLANISYLGIENNTYWKPSVNVEGKKYRKANGYIYPTKNHKLTQTLQTEIIDSLKTGQGHLFFESFKDKSGSRIPSIDITTAWIRNQDTNRTAMTPIESYHRHQTMAHFFAAQKAKYYHAINEIKRDADFKYFISLFSE